MRRRILAVLFCALGICRIGVARAALCHYDTFHDGSGVPLKWTTFPVKFYVNVSKLSSSLQASAASAVQAAFSTYQQVTCTSLQFQYAGLTTDFTELANTILVYWGNDATTWPHGTDSFRYNYSIASTTTGALYKSSIGMNAKDYQWAVGAVSGKIDIQTLVTRIIPSAIGFYVGLTPSTGNQPVKFNFIDHALTQEHIDGVQHLYFKPSVDCTQQPPKPQPCATYKPLEAGVAPKDGGGAKDGSFKLDGSVPRDGARSDAPAGLDPSTTTDRGPTNPNDGSASTDLGGATPPSDNGCCRVGPAPASAPAGLVLLLAAGLLLAHLRRRRR